MYGIAVEYDLGGGTPPDPLLRDACRTSAAQQPGYRRRLVLVADGWRRAVDLFLYATPEAATAALASSDWGERTAAPALLVSECPWGGPVILLRGRVAPTRGGQACWRDHLANAAPGAVLW